jgi:hypothetical protein
MCNAKSNEVRFSPSNIKKYNYICSACDSARRREWDNKNPQKAKVAGRERMRKWRDNKENKEREASRRRPVKYDKSKVDRAKANIYLRVNWHIKQGHIIPKPCEVCGDVNVHAHHDDYSKPLEVRWLCPTHHMRLHKWVV